MTKPDWLAVDWGTTQVRVWAMTGADAVLDRRRSDDGMGRLAGNAEGFDAAFAELTRDWRSDRVLPVVVCGMAGAREGWHAAPYVGVATSLDALADGAVRVAAASADLDVRILPGMRQDAPADVMRGEETKLAGLGARSGVVAMPGTHSKWALLAAGRVQRFHTFMTGDVFQAVATQTVLRHTLAQPGFDLDSFAEAVAEARERPAGLLRHCFGLRATDLLTPSTAGHARAQLSGWLTGLEVADACAMLEPDGPVTLVAGDAQADRYARALDVFGIEANRVDADALTLNGLVTARRPLFPELGA